MSDIVRDHAEEKLEEHPAWWVVLVILVAITLAFIGVTFEHDFL